MLTFFECGNIFYECENNFIKFWNGIAMRILYAMHVKQFSEFKKDVVGWNIL